jgi:hypothetical protein
MTSLRQIEANRRNAAKSTGPTTDAGKAVSRSNAVRHGLTAETVIQWLEDAQDYKDFELSVTADFDARTAVEREMVLRLAGLFWRLRRTTAIETGLLEIYGGDIDVAERTRIGRFAKKISTAKEPIPYSCDDDRDTKLVQDEANVEIAARFLALNRVDGGAFERLNRYETALWRQVGQLLVTLEFLRRYPPS